MHETHKNRFRFVDLFAGIGGMRVAAESHGGVCVFSSEWDRFAQQTYFENFNDLPSGDIREIDASVISDHEFLFAGFPCQAFSIAGKRRGFDDTRGTLFYEVARIIADKKPEYVLLENVKGLTHHDSGRTLDTILKVLRDDLGYFVPVPRLVNAKSFGLPQNRDRIIIVGFRNHDAGKAFTYPPGEPTTNGIGSILEDSPVAGKYYLSTGLLKTLEDHKIRHAKAGNGFGYQIRSSDQLAATLVVGGMGRERNLIVDTRQTNLVTHNRIKGEINTYGIRRLTPREWARLQGFPDSFRIVVSDAQAYKQFGNSVAIPAIRAVVENMFMASSFHQGEIGIE